MLGSWKRDVASGLVVLVPLLVTLYVVIFLYRTIANLPFLATIQPDALRVALTLVLFSFLVLSIGYMMRTAFGDIVERTLDDLMNRIPGLRVVYNASKIAIETALSDSDKLRTPVKIETWDGLRMTAFKTGKTTHDGREIVFLPTSPNITTGYVIEVDPDRLTETDERVEDALTRILSAGFGESRGGGMPLELIEDDQSAGDD